MLIHACFACGSPHWLWHTLHDSEHQAKVGSHSCTESAGDSGLSPDNACMCVSRLRPPRHHPSDRECPLPPPPPAEFCVCVLAKRGSFRHLQRMRLAYSLAFCPAESDLRHQLDAAARLRPPRWRWTGREWPRLLPCSLASTDDSASPAAPSWHSVEPNLTRDARPMPTACFCRFLPLVFVLLNATPQYVSCRSVFILVSSLILQMGDGLLTGSAKLSLTRDTSSIPHDCY